LSLDQFLKYEMDRAKIPVGDGTFQRPHSILDIRRGENSNNPDLRTIRSQDVSKESLEIYVEPYNALPKTHISIERDEQTTASKKGIEILPVKFLLKPKEYEVFAGARPDYDRCSKTVELYEAQQVMLKLPQAKDPNEYEFDLIG
jgi:hypothetical protein